MKAGMKAGKGRAGKGREGQGPREREREGMKGEKEQTKRTRRHPVTPFPRAYIYGSGNEAKQMNPRPIPNPTKRAT